MTVGLKLTHLSYPERFKIIEKINYSKFKAVDISKALKEGRVPHPGPPGEASDPNQDHAMDQAPTEFKTLSPNPHGLDTFAVIPILPSVPPLRPSTPTIAEKAMLAPPSPLEIMDILKFDPKVIQTATKYSKFAISALQYDDVNNAIDHLEKALAILLPYRNKK